jgi:hypothetical protein
VRDSYELVAVADRLDLLASPWAGASAAWTLLPLCTVLAGVGVASHRPFVIGTISLTVGIASISLAVVVFASPLGTELGARAAVVTGAISVVGALVVIAEQRRGT